MFRILTLAAAASLGVAVAASAHPGHPGPGGPGGPHMMMMMMMQEHMASLDKDGDGFISKDEFMAHPSEMFAKLDANHDGRISKDELTAMAAMHGDHRVCKIQHDGDAEAKEVPCDSIEGMHGGPGGPGGPHMMMMHHMAEMMDTNHDGRVSLAEAEAMVREHFKKMDKNGDGYLTKDEAPGPGEMMIEKHIETHQ